MYIELVKSLLQERYKSFDDKKLDCIQKHLQAIIDEYIQGDCIFVEPEDLSIIIFAAAMLQSSGEADRKFVVLRTTPFDEEINETLARYKLDAVSIDFVKNQEEITSKSISFFYIKNPNFKNTLLGRLSPGGVIISDGIGNANAEEFKDSSTEICDEILLWRKYSPVEAELAKYRAYYRQQGRKTLHEWLVNHQRNIVFGQCKWMGQLTLKNVTDVWVYQEIIHEVQPDIIIEIGSYAGGSTLFLANMLDLMGRGKVISLEIDRSQYHVKHDRIIEITGDCSADHIVAEVEALCNGKKTLLIHDGDHRYKSVLRDLRLYAGLVSVGSYCIVEDSMVDVYPYTMQEQALEPPFQHDGPLWAIAEFLLEDDRFQLDQQRERYQMTYNPFGFLRRIR